jgi:predicted metal-dependent peptidase
VAYTLTSDDKLQLARAEVLFKRPYYSHVVHNFTFVAVDFTETMCCTPGLILGYNESYVEMQEVPILAADIAHEVNHFLRNHFPRSIGIPVEEQELFNIAADLAENPDLIAEGWDLSTDALLPAMYGLEEGSTMEEYLEELRKMQSKGGQGALMPKDSPRKKGPSGGTKPQQKKQQPTPQQQQQGQQGQGSKQEQGQGRQPPQSTKAGESDSPGETPGSAGVTRGCCGGIAGNPGGPSRAAKERELDATPGMGRSEPEQKVIAMQTFADIQKHIEAHGRGSVPGSMQELLKGQLEEPVVPWEQEMQYVILDSTGRIQSGGQDYSMRRPSKRSIMRGIIRPSLVEFLPEAAFVIDSSGSMGQKELVVALREAYGVARSLGLDEVWYTEADTRIAIPWKRVGPEFFHSEIKIHGRGGTDFRQPIESALLLNPRPDILFYFTDGDGSVAAMPPPDLTVIWAIVPSYYNKAPARWGRTIIISADPEQRRKAIQYPDD